MTTGDWLVVAGAVTQLVIVGWLSYPFIHPIVKAHIAGSKVKYGRSDTVTTPFVRAVKKKSTGAVWVSKSPGVWKKISYGNKFHKTQAVGYVTSQFDPNTPRNERRFVEVLVKPHWLKM